MLSHLRWSPTSDQDALVALLPTKRRFIVADVTGKGKTFGSLAAFDALLGTSPGLHLLVLVTKSAVAPWRKDLSNGTSFSFLEFTSVTPEHTSLGHDVSVMTYSSMKRHGDFLVELFDKKRVVLVADEFHRAANPDTNIGHVVRYLGAHSEFVWGLTATPLGNHLEALYHLVHIVKPDHFGTLTEFMTRYCVRKLVKIYTKAGPRMAWDIKGYRNMDELATKLKEVMIRRNLEVNVKFQRHTVTPTDFEMSNYYLAASGTLGGTDRDFAARLPDLQVTVNNAVDADRKPNLRDLLSTKEERLISLVTPLTGGGRCVVVFTSSLFTVRRLMLILKPYVSRILTITGASTEGERYVVSGKFGPGDVLVMSPAGGESLNLQAAGDLIFYDLPFDLRQFTQVAGRVARLDSQHPIITLHLLEASGTIDTYKAACILNNAALFQKILSGTCTLPKVLGKISKDAIARLRKDLLWKTKELRRARPKKPQ